MRSPAAWANKTRRKSLWCSRRTGWTLPPRARTGSDRNAAPTWTVHLRGGSQNSVMAWRILQDNGLPRQKVKGLEEVFSTTGMIPTASEEKARLLMALAGELNRTLKSVQGVVDARVQVVLPDNSPLLERSQWSPPTASVLIKYRGAQSPLTQDEVKNLVARGIEGLQADNVAIVFNADRTGAHAGEKRELVYVRPERRDRSPGVDGAGLHGIACCWCSGAAVMSATIFRLETQIKSMTERPQVSV